MNQLGFGVMINMLKGNEKTVKAIENSLNKKINSVVLKDDVITIDFEDTKLEIYDHGQSCCESRYASTDDDLSYYNGSTFLGIELKDAPDQEDEYGECHEICFLEIKTDLGSITFANHNEHNGYYGGFSIEANEKRK